MSENARSESLPPKQQRAIELLLAGKSIVDCASELNVNERTIRRWKMKDTAFYERLQQASNAAFSDCIVSLKLAAVAAIEQLGYIASDYTLDEKHRINASRAILNGALRHDESARASITPESVYGMSPKSLRELSELFASINLNPQVQLAALNDALREMIAKDKSGEADNTQ